MATPAPRDSSASADGRQVMIMVDVEGSLFREIADPRLTRDDVKVTYAFGIRDCADSVDWRRVNEAIIERWSVAALRYIKEGAWRLVGG